MTAILPLRLRRGDYYAHKFILPAADEDDNAIDWTEATFLAQIRTDEDTEDVLAEFAINLDSIADDPPFVVITLDDDITAEALPSYAVWDLQETRNGNNRTPCGGPVMCSKDVSR